MHFEILYKPVKRDLSLLMKASSHIYLAAIVGRNKLFQNYKSSGRVRWSIKLRILILLMFIFSLALRALTISRAMWRRPITGWGSSRGVGEKVTLLIASFPSGSMKYVLDNQKKSIGGILFDFKFLSDFTSMLIIVTHFFFRNAVLA